MVPFECATVQVVSSNENRRIRKTTKNRTKMNKIKKKNSEFEAFYANVSFLDWLALDIARLEFGMQ